MEQLKPTLLLCWLFNEQIKCRDLILSVIVDMGCERWVLYTGMEAELEMIGLTLVRPHMHHVKWASYDILITDYKVNTCTDGLLW